MSIGTLPKTLKVAEAATRLRINREQVLRLVKRGSIGVVRYPGLRPQILEADVERLLSTSVVPASK